LVIILGSFFILFCRITSIPCVHHNPCGGRSLLKEHAFWSFTISLDYLWTWSVNIMVSLEAWSQIKTQSLSVNFGANCLNFQALN